VSSNLLADQPLAERVIVLLLLQSGRDARWSRSELDTELSDIEPSILDRALARLQTEGVVVSKDGQVWASRSARRLDALDLIAI
jgi:DNA-binding HxlR family transcriptional regulator